jgi:hypothetical protein
VTSPVLPDEIRPSKIWYLVAGVVGLLGVGLGVWRIVVAAQGFADKVDDFQRVEIPGTTEVSVDEPGGYTIYVEGPGADDGFGPSTDIALRRSEGDDLELRPYSSSVTYSVSGRDGRAAWSVQVPEAGRYQLVATGESATGSGFQVAFGPGLGSGLAVGIVSGVLLILGGLALATTIAVVTAVRRGRARRLQFMPGQPPADWTTWPPASMPSPSQPPPPPAPPHS